MDEARFEVLPFHIWLAEIGKLARTCAYLPAEHEERAVRRAYHLHALSPPLFRDLSGTCPKEQEIEDLLDRGKAEQAARMIVGAKAAIAVAAGEEPLRYMATVTFFDGLSAGCEANSSALAVVCAWARLFRRTPGCVAPQG